MVVDKEKKPTGPLLVQSTARRGTTTTAYAPFTYQPFEGLFLFRQIDPSHLLSADESEQDSEIQPNGLYSQLHVLDSKLNQLTGRVKIDPEQAEILFTTMKDLAEEKKAWEAEIEALTAKSFKTKTPAATPEYHLSNEKQV